jgi:dynactin complex subunit
LDVEDGDILHVHAQWRPFNQKSEYENKIQKELDDLKKKNAMVNRELDKAKNELEEIQEELNKLQNSKKSFKRLKKYL